MAYTSKPMTGLIGTRSHNTPPLLRQQKSLRNTPLTTLRMASAPTLPKIPNPLKKLPWVVEREDIREKNRLRYEASKLYRELGVAEDANYEEIVRATKALKKRHAGDIKAQVKFDIAKDKIQQIRLNLRTAGLYLESSDAAAEEWMEKQAKSGKKQPKEKEEAKPGFFGGYIQIVPPDKEWKNKVLKVFGIISLIGCVLKIKIISGVSFFWTFGLLAQRGREGVGEREFGIRKRTPMDKKTIISFFVAIILSFASVPVGSAVIDLIPTLEGNAIEYPIKLLINSLINALGSMYLYLNKDGKDAPATLGGAGDM